MQTPRGAGVARTDLSAAGDVTDDVPDHDQTERNSQKPGDDVPHILPIPPSRERVANHGVPPSGVARPSASRDHQVAFVRIVVQGTTRSRVAPRGGAPLYRSAHLGPG